MSFFENTRKPQGLGGKLMVFMMNIGHSAMALWGLSFLSTKPDVRILDCGCGGGENIKKMLRMYPCSIVNGIDYSSVRVKASRDKNKRAVNEGRCAVYQGSVDNMHFDTGSFDAVTAFETVYFWPDIIKCFREVYRVLKTEGTFLICNECDGENEKDEKWVEKIKMMTIYKDTELRAYLEMAGFSDIAVHKSKGRWLCLVAKKNS